MACQVGVWGWCFRVHRVEQEAGCLELHVQCCVAGAGLRGQKNRLL